jgi:hypothetical protein
MLYLFLFVLLMVFSLSFAYLFGLRDRQSLLAMACVSFIAYSIYCYILWISLNDYGDPLFTLLAPAVIVFFQAAALTFSLKKNFFTMLGISLTTNLISYALGALIAFSLSGIFNLV